MPRDPIFPLRLDPERRERWEAAAGARKMSLTEFVRQAGDAAEELVAAGKTAAVARPGRTNPPQRLGKGKPRERTDLCIHRRRPDEFCPRCDSPLPAAS